MIHGNGTIFTDRALSCNLVHASSQLRRAVETIFSRWAEMGSFGKLRARGMRFVPEKPVYSIAKERSLQVTGALRVWRAKRATTFRQNRTGRTETSKKNLLR